MKGFPLSVGSVSMVGYVSGVGDDLGLGGQVYEAVASIFIAQVNGIILSFASVVVVR